MRLHAAALYYELTFMPYIIHTCFMYAPRLLSIHASIYPYKPRGAWVLQVCSYIILAPFYCFAVIDLLDH